MLFFYADNVIIHAIKNVSSTQNIHCTYSSRTKKMGQRKTLKSLETLLSKISRSPAFLTGFDSLSIILRLKCT